MKKYIDDTIKEIILSVIQFDADIKKNNVAGLKKFLDDFVPLLKGFRNLTRGSEVDFNNEFSSLFDYLFVTGKIYEVAENLIIQNEGIGGAILAIRKNGNPLSGKLTISPDRNLFKDFVKKYQGHSDKKKIVQEPITTLKDACNGPGKLEAVKDWFTKMGYCDPDTLDYDYKKYPLFVLASYLKDLNKKGYTKKLSHTEIKAIAKISFNAEMGIDTIKSAKADTADLPPYINI